MTICYWEANCWILTRDICVFWNSSLVSVKLLFGDHQYRGLIIDISKLLWFLVSQFRPSQESSSGSPASLQRPQKSEAGRSSPVSMSQILASKLFWARNLRVLLCVSWTFTGKLEHNYKLPIEEDWLILSSNYSLKENSSL